MKFKTHLAFSSFCFISLISILDISVTTVNFLIYFIVSILPDIDTPKSFLGRFVKPLGWISRHRGFFHSIYPAIGISLLLYFYKKDAAIFAFLGYMSHLVLDALNHQGVGFFYPVSKFRVKGILKSGGIGDKVIFAASLIGIVAILIKFRIFLS